MTTKESILNVVKDNQWCDTKFIASIVGDHIAYNSIKKHLLNLIREGKIERKMKGNTTIYSVTL